jgi:hypothetical protein
MTYIPLSHIKLFASRIYCSGGAAPPKNSANFSDAPFQTRQALLLTFLLFRAGPYVQIILDSRSNVNGEKPGILFKIGPRRFLPTALR